MYVYPETTELIDYIHSFACLLGIINQKPKATLCLEVDQEEVQNQLCNSHSCLRMEPGQKLKISFTAFLECDLYVQSSPPVPAFFDCLFLWKHLDVFSKKNSPPQKDNNQDKVMPVSQLVPHTVQATICLHYGLLSELLEGLGPGDGMAPTEFTFVHKDTEASLAK